MQYMSIKIYCKETDNGVLFIKIQKYNRIEKKTLSPILQKLSTF